MTANNHFINPLSNFTSPIVVYNKTLDWLEYYLERFCLSVMTQAMVSQWDEESLRLLENDLAQHFIAVSAVIHNNSSAELKNIACQMTKKYFISQDQNFFYSLLVNIAYLDIAIIVHPSINGINSHQEQPQIIDAIKKCRASMLSVIKTVRHYNNLLLTHSSAQIFKYIEQLNEKEQCLFFTLCTHFFHPDSPMFMAILAKITESLVMDPAHLEDARIFVPTQSGYQLNIFNKNTTYVNKADPLTFVWQFKPMVGKYGIIHVVDNVHERDVQCLKSSTEQHHARPRAEKQPAQVSYTPLSAAEIYKIRDEQAKFAVENPDRVLKSHNILAISRYNDNFDRFENECNAVLAGLRAISATQVNHLLDVVNNTKQIYDLLTPEALRFCCALRLLEHRDSSSAMLEAARAVFTSSPAQQVLLNVKQLEEEIEFVYCIKYQNQNEFDASLDHFITKVTTAIDGIRDGRLALLNKTEKEMLDIASNCKNNYKILAITVALLRRAENSFFTQQLLKVLLKNVSLELLSDPCIKIVQGCFSCVIHFYLPEKIRGVAEILMMSKVELEQFVIVALKDAGKSNDLWQKCKLLPETIESEIYALATKYYYNQNALEDAKCYLLKTIKLAPDHADVIELFAKIYNFDALPIFLEVDKAFQARNINREQIIEYEKQLAQYRDLIYILHYYCTQYYLEINDPWQAYPYLCSIMSVYPNRKINDTISALHKALYGSSC